MSVENTNNRLAALSALFLFVMLWLPLGQLDFMTQHWMKVGTYAAPVLLLSFFATSPRRPGFSDPLFMSVLLLVAYIAHQFEEHWIDLLGNRYAFYDYVNALIRETVGSADESVAPLTPLSIYVINTSLVWLVGAIAIVSAKRQVFTVCALAAITLVNGMTHIAAGLISLAYNPGLLTSVILFVPLAALYFRDLIRRDPELKKQVLASIVWAVLGHVLMVGGMLAANLFRVMTEEVYFVLLVLWSVLPLALYRGPAHQSHN